MAERIRVAHCLQRVYWGGVERRRLSLARGLGADRFEHLLLCTHASPELRREFEDAGWRVMELGPMKRGLNWPTVRKAARILREFRPHIVHGAVFDGVIIAAFAGSLARVPVIIAEETSDSLNRRWTGHVYMRLLAAIADQVVGVSAAVGDYLVGTLRIPAKKVRVILNGVAEPAAASASERAEVRERYGLSSDQLVIGTVGRLDAGVNKLHANKGLADAIAAMPAILQQFPNARLLIVGDGPDRALLEKVASDHGIADAVIFAGFQGRPRPFVEAMDLLVHPSWSESLGLALVEAMYASRAVVATNVGGIPEVVENGVTGLLVPPRNPPRLAEAIIRLLGEPERRAAMGAAGLQRARARFSEERYVAEVQQLYHDLLVRGP